MGSLGWDVSFKPQGQRKAFRSVLPDNSTGQARELSVHSWLGIIIIIERQSQGL